jgi:CMP-N-acetylneuraminic acid synthetase
MTIAIIIARGGSKRLPRKNVKPFCGHPLVSWAVTQARCSYFIDKVYVSTDDDEIEAIAHKYGAEVIRRPDWPDADLASGTRPMAHATKHLLEAFGDTFDTLVCWLPTKPLIQPYDIDRLVQTYKENGYDNLLFLRPERQMIVFKKLNSCRARTVIFNKTYDYLFDSLGVNVCSPRWFLNYAARMQTETLGDDTDKTADKAAADAGGEFYYIPAENWQFSDVDTAVEFELGEILMEHFILKGRGPAVYEEYARQKEIIMAGNWRQQ